MIPRLGTDDGRLFTAVAAVVLPFPSPLKRWPIVLPDLLVRPVLHHHQEAELDKNKII